MINITSLLVCYISRGNSHYIHLSAFTSRHTMQIYVIFRSGRSRRNSFGQWLQIGRKKASIKSLLQLAVYMLPYTCISRQTLTVPAEWVHELPVVTAMSKDRWCVCVHCVVWIWCPNQSDAGPDRSLATPPARAVCRYRFTAHRQSMCPIIPSHLHRSVFNTLPVFRHLKCISFFRACAYDMHYFT